MNGIGQNTAHSDDRVTLGLVGAGRWGSCYMSTLEGMEGIGLGLVVSRNPQTRQRVPADCEVTDDWRSAVDSGRLDGLILATPAELHYEMALACIEAGLPVLVEKPFTQNPQQASELAHNARLKNSLVMVDHTHIYSSAYASLKHRVRFLEGPLRIHSAGGNDGPFRTHTPALWDWGPHDVSMCMDLAAGLPVSIHASMAAFKETDDGDGMLVNATMDFEDGTMASLEFGNLMARKTRVFEVQGTNGGLIYDDLSSDKLIEYDHHGARKSIGISTTPPLTRAIDEFRQCIVSGQKQHPSLALGIRVVETLAHIESVACPSFSADRSIRPQHL